ncbi:MAG: TlpA family protein disulfide reductase [Dehalococcoidia bacterium]|nr:TlpA family protein disulfide reductase [Dehalococcoidia bacterium]
MSAEPVKKPGQQLAGMAVLGLAVVAAIAAGAFFLFTGGGDDADGPEDTVRALYEAVEDADQAAFDALLTPGVRSEGLGGLVPFPQTLGDYSVKTDQPADVTLDAVQQLGVDGEWAIYGVRGKVLFQRAEFELGETIYLRRITGKWLISSDWEFTSENSGGPTPEPVDGLGVLQPQRPKIGEEAPDFALVSAYDGTVVKLSDFRGKAVVVNFYASWCDPCKEEIPEFQDAQDALADQVVFLGVNFGEDQKRALGILDLFGASYPAVLDSTKAVAQHYRATGLPHTVFVDKDGIVRGIRIGLVTPEALEENLGKVGITYAAE